MGSWLQCPDVFFPSAHKKYGWPVRLAIVSHAFHCGRQSKKYHPSLNLTWQWSLKFEIPLPRNTAEKNSLMKLGADLYDLGDASSSMHAGLENHRGLLDKCIKVAILQFCFAAPPDTHFWDNILLSCYHSCRIFLMHKRKFCSSATTRAEYFSPDKSSAVLLPQLLNTSLQRNILLSCYYKDGMLPTREIFCCSGITIAEFFSLTL